jgi:AraC-like DNA-binding protein
MRPVTRFNTWFTYQSADVWLGEFRLPVDDPAWGKVNAISDLGPLIAFPGTTVRISQQARPSVVADPMRAVLYAAGQSYRREALSADGDRCSFVAFSHDLAAEAARPFDRAAQDPACYRFPFVASPIEASDYRLQQTLRFRSAAGDDDDSMLEYTYWLISRVVSAGYEQGHAVVSGARRRERADVADAVRELIGADLSVSLTLEQLGEALAFSPFHLCRTFREATGHSIHAYRTEVRLRASLLRLADGERLADVAAALGFASQAHFTDRFRRVYGVTPHAWRTVLTGRNVKYRTNLESGKARALLA